MNKIVIKNYLDQFLKDYDIYYENIGKVSKEITHALFSNKCYSFELAVKNGLIRNDLRDVIESAWRISHDEDTIIAILEKLGCEVI